MSNAVLKSGARRLMMQSVVTSIILFGILVPVVTNAGPVIRSSDVVSLEEDQTISGDFYAAGGSVNISGVVEEDAYIAGGTVTINGEIKGDVVVGAGTVSIHAMVGDDIRIAAGQVVIADHVVGDVVVSGGSLTILSTSVIDGDVIFYGGRLDVEGAVGGSIHTKTDILIIDSSITGDVTATIGNQLVLGSHANIEGSIAYTSAEDLARDPGSIVVGEISKFAGNRSNDVLPITAFQFLPLFTALFAALVSILLFGRQIERLVVETLTSTGLHGLIGFGVLVLVPIAAALLIVSLLGALIGVALAFVYILLLLASFVFSGVFFGALISKLFTKRYQVTWLYVILGVVSLNIIVQIPFAGPLFVFVIMLIMLGSIVTVLYKRIH